MWLQACFATALLAVGISHFVVRADHPRLVATGTDLTFDGKPFNGLVLGFHGAFRPSLVATYVQGRHYGPEYTWHANGSLESERHYKSGVYHGVSQTWYDSGRIKTFREYRAGAAHGEQWTWGEDGQVLEYNVYDLDREIAHKTWTFDGKPYHNYVYQDGEKVGIMGEQFCKRRKRF